MPFPLHFGMDGRRFTISSGRSINISAGTVQSSRADKEPPESQRSSYGFVVQTLIIGVGTWIASNLPKFMNTLNFFQMKRLQE
jgi:hypothetical protein